jgi:hypothetical protein
MSKFNVVFEAGFDPLKREPVVRLQAMLKVAWRGFGLRCVEVGEVEPDQPQDVRPPSARRALKEQP